MKTTTLTKEEFITRSMAEEVFIYNGAKYFYDATETIPFKMNKDTLYGNWRFFDGKTVFEIEEPKSILERRWKWRKDYHMYTEESHYLSDELAKVGEFSENGWYKVEDLYIDVEI